LLDLVAIIKIREFIVIVNFFQAITLSALEALHMMLGLIQKVCFGFIA
jgi:hypothetical protein